MKKAILVSLVGIFILCGNCYSAMTDKEVSRSLKSLYEDRKAIKKLAAERRAEEEALILEYKVVECNQKRNALIEKYQAKINELSARIAATEDSLGEK